MTGLKNCFKCALLFSLSFISIHANAQKENYVQILSHQNHWVDSVFKKLSRKQKIAQLFFCQGSY